MGLKYEIYNNNFMTEAGNCIILLENPYNSSAYLARILKPSIDNISVVENGYITVYKYNRKPDILIINIYNDPTFENYFAYLQFTIYSSKKYYGLEIIIYLSENLEFPLLSKVITKYCQDNLNQDLNLRFYCCNSVFDILKTEMMNFKELIKYRENTIGMHLFSCFSCKMCNSFAYEPLASQCCKAIFCKKCSETGICYLCNSYTKLSSLPSEILTIISEAPYYCPCNAVIKYSEKYDHSFDCTVPSFTCKLCNIQIVYGEVPNHLEYYHLSNVIEDNLF